MKRNIPLLLCSALFCLASCTKPAVETSSSLDAVSSTNIIEAATVSFTKQEISVEEESQLTLPYETNRPGQVMFASSDESIAVVSKTGVLLAKKVGDVVIRAAVEDAAASLTVHVIPAKGEAVISVPSKIYLDLKNKGTVALNPKLSRDGVEDATASFTYESKDPTIASVNDQGIVTPVKTGSVLLTIKSGNLTANVLADVYDEAIHTPQEFTTFLTTGRAKYTAQGVPNYRAYLANDLDFQGVVYEGYLTDASRNDAAAFSAEFNGCFHVIKNITFTNDGNPQSLFGQCIASNIYDIAFLNVTYTSEQAGGLAWSVAKKWSTVSTGARFENIYLDLHIENNFGGLITTFYGNDMTNVVAKLSPLDGGTYDTVRGLATNAYNWDQGILQNVIVYSACGSITSIGHAEYLSGRELDTSSLHCTDSLTEAAYWGMNLLDTSRWHLSPTECPSMITE